MPRGRIRMSTSKPAEPAPVVALQQEPELPNVHAEDRVVVRNVLYAAQACLQGENKLENWAVTLHDKHYVVNMYLSGGSDFDVNLRDMQLIADVNPLRVVSVNLSRVGSAAVALRVVVSNRDQPVVITETEVVRLRKRRRFLFG